jgi:hypothetical protein
MGVEIRWLGLARALAMGALALGCGNGGEGPVLRADAQFNPSTAADTFGLVREASPAVAQSFTVQQDGRLEEFWIVVTDGPSADSGTIRLTIQPVDGGGVIDDDPANSLIDPIVVDTRTLPGVLIEEFTEFDIGDEPGRDVLAGERYAIVVEFVSRATSNDTAAIAIVLGQTGDPYAGGSGATGELNVGFTNNTEDYFFRTFVLD